MSKTVQNVKNSLKFKAQEKESVLSIKVGVRKFAVPVKARLLSSGEYLFLSFPASSELYRVENHQLHPMDKKEDATDAFNVLNPGRRTRRRRSSDVVLPAGLEEALKSIPSGYKLGYNTDGSVKLVRTRNRSKA
jgi:hypothetical protein